MPRTTETSLNGHLGAVLREKHPLWGDRIGVEQTGAFRHRPALRPDILIAAPNAQPVVVETEVAPAASVEADAIARLGLIPEGSNEPVEQAIAVRLPASLRHGQADLAQRVASSDYDYCVLAGDRYSPVRWPESGWLTGGVEDIVRCIEHAMVSQRRVEESMAILKNGVLSATAIVGQATARGHTRFEERFGEVLNQRPGEQTTRMAMTIVANALTFHAMVAGSHRVPSVGEIQDDMSRSAQLGMLKAWRHILDEINYWPIFRVASDLLAPLGEPWATGVLRTLIAASTRLSALGVATRHDLSGRMFQTLIMDRKFLATFYTLPTSAALLAEIAVARMKVDWSDLEAYPNLRIADLSCGTGTLLSAAYHSILTRYRHAGGDDARIHREMMENAIVAVDIMPAAAHLCASQLSSVHPSIAFDRTRVYTAPYGDAVVEGQRYGAAIGSLDLIDSDETLSLFATGHRQTVGTDDEVEVRDIRLPAGSLDLVIMNPPFTRPTNHERTDVPVPSFAGFRTTGDEQRAMSDRLSGIRRKLERPAGHGNAGLASNFVDLAHAKAKPGGVVALVLPIAAVQGISWKAARDLFASRYADVVVVSVAASGARDRAFSADTGMAEALIVATRRDDDATPDDGADALFLNLHRRPVNILEAAEAAKLLTRLPETARSGRLRAGERDLGSFVRAPLSEGGCAALRESAIAETMIALREGVLRLARLGDRPAIPMARLGDLGRRGLLHRDIGNWKAGRPPHRGPFRIRPARLAASYPMLWTHSAGRERTLLVEPDSEGEARAGCEARAIAAWKTATRLHFNLDFQLNSQSLAACLTPEPTLGGRAWPNFRPERREWEKVLALWANGTLGLMSFWWTGGRQQQGRAVLTLSGLPDLPVLDPRALRPDRAETVDGIFSRFRGECFLPANEAWRDPVRQALDRAILTELLELPEDILEPVERLRLQWCHEPSVHGGKKTAPEGATR